MHEVDLKKPILGQANGNIDGKLNPDRPSDGHSSIELLYGTRPTYDVTRTPHNSTVLGTRFAEAHSTTAAVQTNGHVLPSGPAVSHIVPPVHGSCAFLAELDGSSVADAPHPTKLALKYKPSIDRMRASENRATTPLVVTNSVSESSLNDSAQALDRRVGELITEYERCVNCPGAYPESNTGV